jgi:WD40 repeat protein
VGVRQVRGLEFSTISPNILASGGEDGELIVWDLTTPSIASTFPPLKVFAKPTHFVFGMRITGVVANGYSLFSGWQSR